MSIRKCLRTSIYVFIGNATIVATFYSVAYTHSWIGCIWGVCVCVWMCGHG